MIHRFKTIRGFPRGTYSVSSLDRVNETRFGPRSNATEKLTPLTANMEDRNNGNHEFWVFGYGSLCWHPGFRYKRSVVGHVKGFIRRFWQGNTTHRGTVENRGRINPQHSNGDSEALLKIAVPLIKILIMYEPGRVATLIKEQEGVVYGRAFQVEDSVALLYLENRECTLGGYVTSFSTFHSRDGDRSFPAIVYIATNKNEHWLGDAPLHCIADQIFQSSGPTGHNVEYLLRLAEFMHDHLPEACDDHLFTLELLVRRRIEQEDMCLRTLMGDRDYVIVIDNGNADSDDENVNDNVNNIRENTFQFLLRIPRKNSRCLKI